MATLSVIRRWALREQLSIREIARRTGLSRNTIRKYLRAGEAEPHYAKRVSPSKLDPFALKLAGWLKTEAGRSRKQRRTIKQMYVDLQALGYGGSYNRVAAFARLWHEQRLVAQQTTGRGTFVPLEVLALVLHHDEQAVLAAVELALESGAASKTHILNVLHRLLDDKPAPAPVTSPQALKLAVEPQANVLRYDQLREVRYAS